MSSYGQLTVECRTVATAEETMINATPTERSPSKSWLVSDTSDTAAMAATWT
jgi:hypothetical protein